MTDIWVAIITALIAPVVLFVLQWVRDSRHGVKQDIKEIKQDVYEAKISSLRLELLNAIQHNPDDEITILALFDKYTRLGGNSYIRAYVQRWKQEHYKTTESEPKELQCSPE